ncbi:tyrosinase family oxidase copper chaperone [Streptomyces sp. NPDC058417]|uniref:tyrosinase family oxidase copper chaperone n=1 Tax=unclassified Streptomyces TaxID=2593676 RepID=UPI0036527C39
MAVSVNGTAVPAVPGEPAGGRTRRAVLLGGTAVLGLVPVALSLRSAHPGGGGAEAAFDEVRAGRRLRGRPAAGTAGRDGAWEVTLDGRPLHLMRRADGTWLSMVDHYCSYATPLAAARAAADELGPGRALRAVADHHPGHTGPATGTADRGERHGVRA